MDSNAQLTHAQLLELKRWNTPSVYNGWEQVTKQRPNEDGFNLEPVVDFMPQMGPMIGYAVTVVIEPRNAESSIPNLPPRLPPTAIFNIR